MNTTEILLKNVQAKAMNISMFFILVHYILHQVHSNFFESIFKVLNIEIQ